MGTCQVSVLDGDAPVQVRLRQSPACSAASSSSDMCAPPSSPTDMTFLVLPCIQDSVYQLWRDAILSDEMVVAQFGGPMLQAFRTRLTGESVEQHASPISPESDDADAALMEALEDDGEMD